ncbi:phage/plasmid primase, P4 family [Microbacterium keratanolyticum]
MSGKRKKRPYADAVAGYVSRAWPSVLPVVGKGGKGKLPTGCTGYDGTVSRADRDAWAASPAWRGANIAIRHELTLAFDEDSATVDDLRALLEAERGEPLPDLASTWSSTARGKASPRRQRFYRLPSAVPEGMRIRSRPLAGMEIPWRGHRYSVVEPSIHPATGERYRWYSPTGERCDAPAVSDLPLLPVEWFEALLEPREDRSSARSMDLDEWHDRGRAKPTKRVRAAVKSVPTSGADEGDLLAILGPVVAAAWEDRAGRLWARDKAAERWMRGAIDNDSAEDFSRAWMKKVAAMPDDLTATFPLSEAERKRAAPAPAVRPRSAAAPDALEPDEMLLDGRRAEVIASDLRGRVLYVDGHSPYVWDGVRWQMRDAAYVLELVREWHLERVTNVRTAELATFMSASRIRASEVLIRGQLAVRADQLDAHPHLLNVRNGVLDLRTGDLSPHDPELRLTHVTAARYLPGARHADWDAALTALPGDVGEWLQVRLGQGLTGHPTPDDRLLVLHGGGKNGKSVMLTAINSAVGDGFSRVVPHKVLLGSPSDHTTELTTLQGARLAWLEELPEGNRLDVVRLKSVLGTEWITARRMRQDNSTFPTTHSLYVTTNYRPSISETDHGTWRRLALVEFPFTFVTGRQVPDPSRRELVGDPGLRGRLKAGRAGRAEAVLAWLVEGAMRFYAAGEEFPPLPLEVEAATTDWRASADSVHGFIVENVIFDEAGFASSQDLYRRFSAWLGDRGHAKWSETLFAERLARHELMRCAIKGRPRIGGKQVSGWTGLSLRPNQEALTSWDTKSEDES